jgi:hypothetical protein
VLCCAVLSCAVLGCCHSLPQEYNICFTTVKRPTDGSMPALPTAANGAGSGSLAPLPTVIQGLVRKRREVKAQMKTCRYGVQKGPLLLGHGSAAWVPALARVHVVSPSCCGLRFNLLLDVDLVQFPLFDELLRYGAADSTYRQARQAGTCVTTSTPCTSWASMTVAGHMRTLTDGCAC